MKIKRDKLVFFLLLAVVYFSVKSQFLTLPLHNDEFNHMEGVINIIENNFSPFVEWWSYHPPLVYELVAYFVSFFAQKKSILITRLIIAVFGFLSLIFTYLLGREVFNERTGKFAAIFLFFLPIFQGQSSLFHLAVPLTFFSLATFYYYLKKKWLLYFTFASLLVLTKEIGVLIVFSITFYDFVLNAKPDLFQAFKKMIVLNLPQLLFIGWMFLNKKYLGWYLWPYNVSFFVGNNPYPNTTGFVEVLRASLLEKGTFVLTVGIAIGLMASFFNKNIRKIIIRKEALFVLVVVGLFSLLFGYGPFLPRYMLFIYPLLCMLFAGLINYIIKKNGFMGSFILIAIIIIMTSRWFSFSDENIKWAGEQNYQYLRIINHHRQVVIHVKNNYYYDFICNYPLNVAFSWPQAGYVNEEDSRDMKDISAVDLDDYKGSLIISDFFINSEWNKVINSGKLSLVETIQGKGIKTSIYRTNPK
jgi:4-amino-4-deoxy-L-arabinose transferase-like glycosyltransferase